MKINDFRNSVSHITQVTEVNEAEESVLNYGFLYADIKTTDEK